VRTKVTLVLIFLNVALFFFIFKFERQWRTDAQLLETRHRVLGAEAADIRTLEITSAAPGGTFRLVRNRDAWMLTSPLDWPASGVAVESILHDLALLENITSFPTKDLAKSGQSLADYGLDKPKLTIAFTSGDPAGSGSPTPTVLTIGDTTKVGNRLYVLSPDRSRVHVVNRSLIDSASLTLDQIRANTLLTIPVFEARSLSVQTSNNVRVRVRYDGSRWMFDAPISNARASKLAVEIVIKDLIALRVKTFLGSVPATLPSSAPFLRVELEGNNRHEKLFLGEVVPPADGKTPALGETEYFAQLEGRTAVFTVSVPNGLVETLRGATEKLREAHLLDFDPRAVTAINLIAPLQSNQAITLQRLETPATPTEAAAWQVVRRGSGNQGLQTTPADRVAIQNLLGFLTQLSAKPEGGFVSDNPSSAELENWGFNRPEREVTLTLARPPAPATAGAAATTPATSTIVLQLGTDAARNVFARVGTNPDASIYAVSVDLARDLPFTAMAWRERTLLTVPANGRIASLKLIDLGASAGTPLLETAFNAAGEPAATVRDPKAVNALAQQLRVLRAKRFRSEAFTDKVIAGGDERAWRYQLDFTIALPAGTGEQTETRTLFLTERLGGAEQLAGSKQFDVVFEIEQPLLDALWTVINGPRDPGPPATKG
jgi:hypothetical protein